MWDTHIQILDWEDPLEKGMEIHSSTLAWKIPWMKSKPFQGKPFNIMVLQVYILTSNAEEADGEQIYEDL